MKRIMVFMLLALLALSGFSGGIWADEATPPPDPGIEDGGTGEPGEEPGGDDNPWGGEERSSGNSDPSEGYGLDGAYNESSDPVVAEILASDLWTPYFQRLIVNYFLKMKASLENQMDRHIKAKPAVNSSRIPDKRRRER